MYLGAVTPAVKARQSIERRIVLSTIDELLAQGFALRVFDGEATSPATTDKAAVVESIMNTDDDHLLVLKDGKSLGWIRFVYGNDGFDVMSDYTVNVEPFISKSLQLAERLAN